MTALVLAAATSLLSFADPSVGCSANGHCSVAASAPFGMVQPGPDTGTVGWDYCSGYRFEDTALLGFSQTRISGTGAMDLGDVLILPHAGVPRPKTAMDKGSERCSPGFYRVRLPEDGIDVEVTASQRVARYRMGYSSADGRLLVDFSHGIGGNPTNRVRDLVFSKVDGRTFSGSYHRSGWVERTVNFAIRFSEEPKSVAADGLRRNFAFAGLPDRRLEVAISFSLSSPERAVVNLGSDDGDFERVRAATEREWEGLFARLRVPVETDPSVKTNLYTALYHLFLQPNDLSDAGEKPFYSTFSTWDTFRAAHSLYAMLVPERVDGFVDSLLEQGRRTGFLPIWALWGQDNQCMVGTHSIPIIVDAYLRGFRGFDADEAYRQVRATLLERHPSRQKEGWDLLEKYGYYPADLVPSESVSRTLECAYDFACAARFAEALGKAEDVVVFRKLASIWRNVFDPSVGFMRPRNADGGWRTDFTPFSYGYGSGLPVYYTEANCWQYTWHVLHDIPGLIDAFGGREPFVRKLDELFSLPEKVEGQGSVGDVSGQIGQYAHGNEPDHHVAFLYALAGRPEKTAEIVRKIAARHYRPTPDGICGNEDCGQMSAWYVFACLGFYPVDPCGREPVRFDPLVRGVSVERSAIPVDFASLLREMTDRDALTRFPEPSFRTRLWSSTERASVSPDRPGWFANRDWNGFVRTETNAAGRIENVLVDAKGPGALTRFWFAGDIHTGATVRVYLDGGAVPFAEGLTTDLAGGRTLCGWPLSAGLAPESPVVKQGSNLYLPIPYANGCKVTVEIPAKGNFYYNIETRAYAEGTVVRTLTREALVSASNLVARTCADLKDCYSRPEPAGERRTFDGELKPGETRTLPFSGEGAIRLLRLKSVSPNEYATEWWGVAKPQLRWLELDISFDGVSTVKLPAGEFFNTGLWSWEPYETYFCRVTNTGVMESRWTMPFRESCVIRLTNRGEMPIVLSKTSVVRGDYAWDGRSMRFGTTYVSRPRQPTRVKGLPLDLTLDDLSGRGRVVGTGVSIENSSREWWGEGDEKVWIDGEPGPSYVGTGTEDHFGYAWCRHEAFSHPFLAQPCGDGNGDGRVRGGHSVNFRARTLDAIPFFEKIRFDIELWHWEDTLVDYNSTSFHYLMRADE